MTEVLIKHVAYLKYSKDNFDCFLAVVEKYPSMMDKFLQKYFLLGRSLELLFKSWLVYKGFTENQIKSELGHDIRKILERVKELDFESELNLHIDIAFEAKILNLNRYYKYKDFEYPNVGTKTLVIYNQLIDPINLIIDRIEEHYRQQYRRQRLKNQFKKT